MIGFWGSVVQQLSSVALELQPEVSILCYHMEQLNPVFDKHLSLLNVTCSKCHLWRSLVKGQTTFESSDPLGMSFSLLGFIVGAAHLETEVLLAFKHLHIFLLLWWSFHLCWVGGFWGGLTRLLLFNRELGERGCNGSLGQWELPRSLECLSFSHCCCPRSKWKWKPVCPLGYKRN